MGGLHVASGWLARSQWLACTWPVGGLHVASGWVTSILLALFVIATHIGDGGSGTPIF